MTGRIGARETKPMTIRQSFFEATKLKNIWNTIIVWNEYKLATVQWHQDKVWKIVSTLDFDLITERTDKKYVIAEFNTQQELWEYIKLNIAKTL